MPFSKDYHIVSFNKTNRLCKEIVVMTSISKEEEDLLDEGKDIKIDRGNRTFTVQAKKIYCYGEVNFNNGSNDLAEINTFNFLEHLDNFTGACICSDYDYKNHECHSPIKQYRYTHTWQPARLCQYAHGCLKKPKRIVLFRTNL